MAFEISSIEFPWYWINYGLGFIIILFLGEQRLRKKSLPLTQKDFSDLMTWGWFGVFLGGRLGYVLFYNFDYYYQNPDQIYQFWNGGMSFHGAILGIFILTILGGKLKKTPLWDFWDTVCLYAPWALMFGRLANFVNGELVGRPTKLPWAVVFPRVDPIPRHPSQIYEAIGEGPILFLCLLWLQRKWKNSGIISGGFIAGYGLIRFFIENFRRPDPQIGHLWIGLTLGQFFCLGMVFIGIAILGLRTYSRVYCGRNRTQ